MKYLFVLTLAMLATINSSAQSYKLEGNELVLDKHISFKKGTAQLLPESEAALTIVKTYLEDKSYISLLRIEGHCATDKNNQELSERRAMATAKWLTEHGVDCKRLIVTGYGETKPIVAGDNDANSRMTFVNAGLRGRLIGGSPAEGGGKIAGDACQ